MIAELLKKKTIVFNSLKQHYWITAYSKRILVQNMSTLHINNCIACWEGRGNKDIPDGYLGGKEKWLTIFNQELARRN